RPRALPADPARDRRRDRRDRRGAGPARDRAAAFGDMMAEASSTAEQVVARLQAAMNAHDVDAFVACFAEDYDSVQPAHPDRAFRGREQVRANWSEVFAGVPDLRAGLARASPEHHRPNTRHLIAPRARQHVASGGINT